MRMVDIARDECRLIPGKEGRLRRPPDEESTESVGVEERAMSE